MQPQFIEQRTDEWHLQRKGRFTASEILDICESDQKRETAVFNKVYEAMMPDDVFIEMKRNERSSPSMDWGTLYESEAKAHYERVTGKVVTNVGFVSYGNDSGGSPDGLILADNGQTEFKCPFNGAIHLRFFGMKHQYELLEYCKYGAAGKKYYYQIQANILFNNSDYCDFMSYDPRLIDLFKGKPLRVEPDEKVMKEIEDSIKLASEMKQEMLLQIIKSAG